MLTNRSTKETAKCEDNPEYLDCVEDDKASHHIKGDVLFQMLCSLAMYPMCVNPLVM